MLIQLQNRALVPCGFVSKHLPSSGFVGSICLPGLDERSQASILLCSHLLRHVKAADKDIVAALKLSGRLVDNASINHSYPFCWRSDTPLIYRAVPSWFIAVESIKEKLLANNEVRSSLHVTHKQGFTDRCCSAFWYFNQVWTKCGL